MPIEEAQRSYESRIIEEKVQKFWKDRDIYERTKKMREDKPKYSFLMDHPTAVVGYILELLGIK